ncbi:uncharacterized protein LOC121384508 isoform X2 [Gigantopelta aegis]|uniref:uncharacterized protein LOC121384508 isoform X2 n=1 Tax=Gigantopelta aegis TaxID=1735272 RepID=UPI001B8881D5|nr:uncharacterized protein LOC121384508 isoform X2 [Gigantopelta aegis]
MSKELPGGAQNDSSVFSLLRNFDRYNDDNFKLSQTPPGGLNSPPNSATQKSRFPTLEQEDKNTVIIHTSGPSVGPSPVNSDKPGNIHASVGQPSYAISDEVLRSKLTAVTPGRSSASQAASQAPHSSDQTSPSSKTIAKLYEKAVGRTSQSQPSSPHIVRRMVRISSMDNFEKISGGKGEMKEELVMAGKSQVVAASAASVAVASSEQEHAKRMCPVPEMSSDSMDSAFPQTNRSRSGLGQWLWGKESKVTVKDREMNFISPTSF